jgi:hypothetical protein
MYDKQLINVQCRSWEVNVNSALDQAVAEAAEDFVKRLSLLNSEPYIREAVWKMAIREVVWGVFHEFDAKYELPDHLNTLARVVGLPRD